MRFQLPADLASDATQELHRAYVSGFDGRIYATRIEINQPHLLCRRTTSESGKLNVPWPVAGFGRPIVSTSSLMERSEPYLLAVELARGKICSLRDQISAWQLAGMAMPDGLEPLLQKAHRLFARAASQQTAADDANQMAQQALDAAFQAAALVTRAYSRQRLMVRRRRGAALPTVLGCDPGAVSPEPSWGESFSETFTGALLPVRWNLIEPEEGNYHWDVCDELVEWCREQRIVPFGGPLIDFGPHGLPEWLQKWEHDFFNMQSFLSDFVETAVGRYVGRVRHWEVAACGNTGGGSAISEENRLMLVARVLESARQVDEEVQLMIRIEQPWGEYMARGQHQLTPMQFVDALLRSGVGLSAVNLEVAFGYRPTGSGMRDTLDFSKLIDQWGGLGLPLNVILACPSSSAGDPLASSDLEVSMSVPAGPWSEEFQMRWIDQYLPVLMSKQSVAGIFWTHFSDQTPHRFPNAGLLRADGTPKTAFGRLAEIRTDYWKSDDRPH